MLDPGDIVGVHYEVDWNVDGVHLVGVRVTLLWAQSAWVRNQKIYYEYAFEYQLLIPIRADDS